MKYMAIDSGGSKVAAILYDENFKLLARARTGSMRSNTTSKELIEQNVRQLFEQLGLREGDPEGIELVSGIPDGDVYKRLCEKIFVKGVDWLGELELGLYAAEIFDDGILALSGTGCTLFSQYEGKIGILGGYGAAVADEGSGYWIGRHAVQAAIKADEGRGEDTLLLDLIRDQLGRDKLQDGIFAIYGKKDISPVACVASFAPLTTKAANMGDRVAQDILIAAGEVVGQQLNALCRREELPDELPVTISGSVWRGNDAMFERFCQVVREHTPDREIRVPCFEPIVGSVIWHYYKKNGKFDASDRAFFEKEYADYLFDLSETR